MFDWVESPKSKKAKMEQQIRCGIWEDWLGFPLQFSIEDDFGLASLCRYDVKRRIDREAREFFGIYAINMKASKVTMD